MNSTALVLAVRHLALVLLLATAALLGDTSAARADGPLTLKATLSLASSANDLIVDGILAYVATDKGLTIVNISDLNNLSVVASVASVKGNHSLGLAKKGPYVYLAAGTAGMQVIDVSSCSTPAACAPHTVATVAKAGRIFDVAVHPTEDAAYSVSYNGELYVWDTSPLKNHLPPALTQTLGVIRWGVAPCNSCIERMSNGITNGQSYLTGVTTAGNVVVTADWGYGGLYSWDSANPLQLKFRGTHRLKNSMSRMEIDLAHPDGPVVYVLLTYGGKGSGAFSVPLSRFYTSDLSAPAIQSYSAHSNTPHNDPTVCPVCGQLDSVGPMDGGGIGFSANHKYAFYVGGRGNGELRIINVRDPVHMFAVPLATIPVGPPVIGLHAGKEAGIVSSGDHLFVAAGLAGFRVYECPGLSAP